MVEPLPLSTTQILDKLFEMQRDAYDEMLRAVYGSKPFWISVGDDGDLIVTPIEPRDLYVEQDENK